MSEDSYIQIKELLDNPFFIEWTRSANEVTDQYWNIWLSENPHKQEVFYKAVLIAKGVKIEISDISKEKVEVELSKLDQKLDQVQKPFSQNVNFNRRLFFGIAASITLIIASSVIVYLWYWNSTELIVTGYGERKEFVLSDGTEVLLNAQSTISYCRNDVRNVSLTGEAFFKVAKKKQTGEKFFVKTSDLDIVVLGTEFNVNTRENQTQVLLEEGKVKIDIENQESIFLDPGDLIAYSRSTKNILRERPIKLEVVTSWKDGILLLDNIPLKDALKLLHQTYGVEVDFQNKNLENKILKGGVPSNDLELCIRTLNTIYNLNIQNIDNVLVVK